MTLPCFYPIIDTALLARAGIAPAEMARALALARAGSGAGPGAGIAQFRHKGSYTVKMLVIAEECRAILRETGVRCIINDRADIAKILKAGGVHLGQHDLSPRDARRVAGENMMIGHSTHNEEQLRAADAGPADYLAIGPIFATRSKSNPDPVVGIEELARLRSLTKKPLVAIGGITRDNAREVIEAGADSVAVISDIIAPDLPERLAEWMELLGRLARPPAN